MDLNNKLEGLPTIYYFNLDNRIDRREYMESQFDRWKIKDFKRISSSKYLGKEHQKWNHLILDEEIKLIPSIVANSLTHLETIKNWLETTNDPYLILMEDDYDLNLIEYWNFDWEYLMNNIPENWDCIQLGFENISIIPFFLHPVHCNHGFGPCLINRFYAEKIVRLHFVDDKFLLNIKTNDIRYKKMYGCVDSFILEDGKTYSIPLITNNPFLHSDVIENQREWFFVCRELYYDWWTNYHHKFLLSDFFTYGKQNDYEMTRKVNLKNKNKILYT